MHREIKNKVKSYLTYSRLDLIHKQHLYINNKNYDIMKTISEFRIAENSKELDIVELIYDELLNYYSVRWKWTSMREAQQRDFLNKTEAKELYLERKHFAILCN